MLLKSTALAMLFASLLAADSTVFDVRSYVKPDAKAKVPVDGKMLSNLQTFDVKSTRQCAIPLAEVTPPHTNDKISPGSGAFHADPKSVMKPPVPACAH